jgi:hypothetical protein
MMNCQGTTGVSVQKRGSRARFRRGSGPRGEGLAAVASRALLVAVLTGLASTAADADEWSLGATVNQRFEADDNIRMQSSGDDTVYGSITSPELRLRGRSPVLDVSLFGKFDFGWFSDSDLNTDDQQARLASTYRTETGIFGLDAEVDRDTTRTSELTDTGVFDVIARRLRYRLAPSYTAIVTPRNRLRVDGAYTDVTYDTGTLSDYAVVSGGATWQHDYTQKTEVTLGVSGYHYETTSGPDSETDLIALLFGVNHKYSERLSVSANIGPRYATIDNALGRENSIGVQLGAGVEYLMSEQTTISGSVDRSVSGSASGTTPERNTLRLSIRHQFLPRWDFLFGALYIKDEDDSTSGTGGREYISLEPAVRWQVARNVDLSTSYRYRRQEFDSGSEADSNAVFITLTYRAMPWILAH